jgi:putative GTP pyrophosphokinase
VVHVVSFAVAELSGSQVRKAGKVLRAWNPASQVITITPEMEAAWVTLQKFRALHSLPLIKANNGLRSRLKTVGIARPRVSQRLKRMPTIISKLFREPTMQLNTMQDIAGCRAVLETMQQLRTAQKRYEPEHIVRTDDYVAEPRASGYRGLHLIVRYTDVEDVPRCVEVQLRTKVQHEWAFTVEQWGGRIDSELKSGEGPEEVLKLLRLASEAMALEEKGETVPSALRLAIDQARLAASPFLVRGREP